MGKLQRYIGNKKFYKMVLAVAMPIMIQNGITNLVGMLDNIMVGQVGTVQMNGVAIVNQLLFVFNLCIFGAASGAGIFTAQFSGSGDQEGVRHTFRFKILVCLLLSAVGIGLLLVQGPQLIGLYLKGEGSAVDAADSLRFGREYLLVMLWGLVPFALANVYASTLRETGETVVPMVAGVGAVLVNLFFNYVLIFGHFGAPAMGVRGAAIATVISRFVELGILAAWTHGNPEKNPFIVGAYRSMRIPGHLTGAIVRKGLPLMINEFLWSLGMTVLSQCYSTRGLHVIGAMNITNTLWNVFSVSFLAMGNAVGIIMGRMLGAGGTEEEARDANRKLSAFSVAVSMVFAVLYGLTGQVFPNIYNTTDQVRSLARDMAQAFPGGKLVFDGAGKAAVKLMLKTWIMDAKIRDVGAYFSVADAKRDLAGWSPNITPSSRGYMLGYDDLKDPAVSPLFRTLARVGDGIMKMQIVRLDFGGKANEGQ